MKVAVVKYNAGNIRSVDYALKRLGVEAVITADKEELQSADKVIWNLSRHAVDVPAFRRRRSRLFEYL